MGWGKFLNKTEIKKKLRDDTFDEERIGTLEIPNKLTDENAFQLASTVSEIHFPIDFIADRASKIRYYVAKGETEVKGDLARFVNDINPLFSFSDIVYSYFFNQYSDGNVRLYRSSPKAMEATTVNSISRIDVLSPDELELLLNNNVGRHTMSKLSDAIRRAWITNTGISREEINVNNLIIHPIDSSRRADSIILSKSPLFSAYRNVNNLLAAYSARYNVYYNNGYAGIITRKTSDASLENVADSATREKIEEDLKARSGVLGKRRLIGISSTPIEFVKTMASIRELMPFDECFEDSIAIAGVYQIKSDLIPRKDNSTFANQKEAERSVWENTLMSAVDSFCKNWTKICMLDTVGCEVKADYTSVSALKSNDSDNEAIIKQRLENLKAIKDIDPTREKEINTIIEQILNGYGQ